MYDQNNQRTDDDELEKQSPTSVEKNQGKLIIDATNGHQLSI